MAQLSKGRKKRPIDLPSTMKLEKHAADLKLLREKAGIFANDVGAADDLKRAELLLRQICEALPSLEGDAVGRDKINFTFGAIHALQPRDGLEALLCAQLLATHSLGMEFLRRSTLPNQTVEGIDRNINRATRLLRVFTNLTEARRANRNGGQQHVVVEHVTVNAGGQAIVGNGISNMGGGDGEKGEE